VFILTDFAQAQQLAKAFGLEILQGGDRHKLLNILNIFFKILRFDHFVLASFVVFCPALRPDSTTRHI
jgi:hypothetical protein